MAQGDTIFHKIARREIPANFLYEDGDLFAIRDINPASPTHVLIIPKETVVNAAAVTDRHDALVGKMVRVAADLARREGIAANGYRLVFNCGSDGGQTVDQLHLHLLGGRELSWPPG